MTQGYSLVEGASDCAECPANAMTVEGGKSCKCDAGFFAQYHVDPAVINPLDMGLFGGNKSCTPCPEGGACPGNDLLVGTAGWCVFTISSIKNATN